MSKNHQYLAGLAPDGADAVEAWRAAIGRAWTVLPNAEPVERAAVRAFALAIEAHRRTGHVADVRACLAPVAARWIEAGAPEANVETLIAAQRRAMEDAVTVVRSAGDRRCPCGGGLTIAPGAGPHWARFVCRICERFNSWVKRPGHWALARTIGGES
jgi:hypothetical protein